MVLLVAIVFGEVFDSEFAKALAESPLDDIRRVIGEIDAAELIDEIPKESKLFEVQGRSDVA